MSDKPWRDKETLERLYWADELSVREIADEIGCAYTTVLDWMDRLEIPRRESKQDSTGPWQDKETLQQLYVNKGLTTYEVADELGCSQKTATRWLGHYNIERRPGHVISDSHDELRDANLLYELYHELGMSTYAIAERFGCNPSQVQRWLAKHGIELRDSTEELHDWQKTQPASYYIDGDGYEHWKSKVDGTQHHLRVHRLLAVAKYGFGAVTRDIHVHHENGIPWDNRPSNITLVTPKKHAQIHHSDVEVSER